MIVRVAHIQYALSQLLASSGLAPVLGPFNQNPPYTAGIPYWFFLLTMCLERVVFMV